MAAFGGTAYASISGNHTSAAQDAEAKARLAQSPEITLNDYQAREVSLLLRRGGFVVGDVVVGNLRVSDSELMTLLPGRLNFVLTWDGGPKRQLTDLNLAVLAPEAVAQLNRGVQLKDVKDAVGNPPFIYSLNPTDPTSIKQRDSVSIFHQNSPSGGHIGLNSVGPEGLEIASWSGKFPSGKPYGIMVSNVFNPQLFAGTNSPPGQGTNPIKYEIRVFLDGRPIIQYTDTVGLYEGSTKFRYIPNPTARAKPGR